ncbi:hypothetical protein AMK32_30440 [Streptomyces sp. CB01883]|nr:hypothetical protein AMK32_30440 [Streptomyces sp. CB01883]
MQTARAAPSSACRLDGPEQPRPEVAAASLSDMARQLGARPTQAGPRLGVVRHLLRIAEGVPVPWSFGSLL